MKKISLQYILLFTSFSFFSCSIDFFDFSKSKSSDKPKEDIAALFHVGGNISMFENETSPFGGSKNSQESLEKKVNKATLDPTVKEIIFHLSSFSPGWARASELSQIIKKAAAKKPVTCIIESADNKTYFTAASSCSTLYIAPAGGIDLVGLSAESFYLKDLLTTLGAKAEMLSVGKYKSAAENLTRNEMSEDSKEATSELLHDINDNFISQIAQGRKINTSEVKNIIANGPYHSTQAKKNNLVDDILSLTSVITELNTKYKGGVDSKYGETEPKEMNFSQFLKIFTSKSTPKQISATDKIAIIPLLGPIASGRGEGGLLGTSTGIFDISTVEILHKAATDKSVKAVVLRIDSPGGSPLASDNIWEAIKYLSEKKPVIASMGDVAASGGYYIASAAHQIVTNKNTITGSIGVVGGKIVLEGTMEKLNIHTDSIQFGNRARMMSPFSPFSQDEKDALMGIITNIYDLFITRVKDGRNMPVEKIESLAQGRVWSGTKALEYNLADETGTLQDAVSLARKKLNMPEIKSELYPAPKSLMELLGEQFSSQVHAMSLENMLIKPLVQALQMTQLLQNERCLVLLPQSISIK